MEESSDNNLICSDCGNELSIYQIGTDVNKENVVMQVGNERRDATEFITKSSTQAGAKANAGMSSSGPKVSGGSFLQNINAFEDKDATSDAKNFSITQSSGHTIQITWLNPENADPDNDEYFSGCVEDPDCPNSVINDIESVVNKSETISQLIQNNNDIDSGQIPESNDRKGFDDSLGAFLDGIDESEMSIDGVDPRNETKGSSITGSAVNKVKSGVRNAASSIRTGTSTAVHRARDGFGTTVSKVKQWYGDDGVPEQASDPASPEPETTETTIRVSPGDTDPSVSYTNGDLNMAFRDGTDTDPTVLHVAAAGDEQVPVSSTAGDFSTTLTDGEMQLSPGTDDAVQMSPGTDGEMSFSIDDGSMVQVDPGDDETNVVPGNDGDFHMAFGDGHATDGPTTEPDNPRTPEPDTTQATDPNTTQTTASDSPQPNGSNNSPTTDPDNSQDNEVPEPFRDQKPTDVTWKSDEELEEIRKRRGVGNGTPDQDATEQNDDSEPTGTGPR